MVSAVFLLALLVCIALLAPRFGVDSRGLSSQRPDPGWYPGHPRD